MGGLTSFGIRIFLWHGKSASSDYVAANPFLQELANFTESEGYLSHQVCNFVETGLFWKNMPNRIFITQEEWEIPMHKLMKGRVTHLLCANASDYRIKSLLVY